MAARAPAIIFSMLGLKPQSRSRLTCGRRPAGAPNVALISENLWRKHFAGSPSVLGQRALIDGLEREIIGVVSERVRNFGRNPDVLLPLSRNCERTVDSESRQSPGFFGPGPAETWCDDVTGNE